MTPIGDFKDLSIYLDKDKGIILVDNYFMNCNTYEFSSKYNIFYQLNYLQLIKKNGFPGGDYFGRYNYLVLYKQAGTNFWILDSGPINEYGGLEFCDFILDSELIKDFLIINDILE